MNTANQTAHEFRGVRLQIDSTLAFDEVLRRLHEQAGESSVPLINEVAANSASSKEFDAEVTRRFVGPSGFMVFAQIEHSTWIAKYGISQRVVRIIFGNPLFAITMMREDISAGLFAPVEMLLVENTSGSTLYYVRPSTLMVTVDNPPLRMAAIELDRKLEQLIAGITGLADVAISQASK
ncbi:MULTISPECIES: DUF302 domain-containing protein [Acidobacteriaceae]|uniref:DUF302 domain-containing protein n=1 Tax=Acidobacteriaceae TaxID=204434 RepID=UPI00131EB34D|nr:MULTISPECIES: DUF302 domain-containing protein [Acidobacteriaceae]MDW5265521.1 DUF302 domain-containing protein [Edaphobacter sp.]